MLVQLMLLLKILVVQMTGLGLGTCCRSDEAVRRCFLERAGWQGGGGRCRVDVEVEKLVVRRSRGAVRLEHTATGGTFVARLRRSVAGQQVRCGAVTPPQKAGLLLLSHHGRHLNVPADIFVVLRVDVAHGNRKRRRRHHLENSLVLEVAGRRWRVLVRVEFAGAGLDRRDGRDTLEERLRRGFHWNAAGHSDRQCVVESKRNDVHIGGGGEGGCGEVVAVGVTVDGSKAVGGTGARRRQRRHSGVVVVVHSRAAAAEATTETANRGRRRVSRSPEPIRSMRSIELHA